MIERCSHCGQEIVKRVVEPKTVNELNGAYINPFFVEQKILQYLGFKSLDQITVSNKRQTNVYARQLMMTFLRKKSRMSLPDIAAIFNKHHTTVIAAINVIDNLMFSDPNVRKDVTTINNLLDQTVNCKL